LRGIEFHFCFPSLFRRFTILVCGPEKRILGIPLPGHAPGIVNSFPQSGCGCRRSRSRSGPGESHFPVSEVFLFDFGLVWAEFRFLGFSTAPGLGFREPAHPIHPSVSLFSRELAHTVWDFLVVPRSAFM
jgi:hypothetical protein